MSISPPLTRELYVKLSLTMASETSIFLFGDRPESGSISQSDCLMEVALAIVSLMLPAMEKELGT